MTTTVHPTIDRDILQLVELTTTKTFNRIEQISNLHVALEGNESINGEVLFFEFDYRLNGIDTPIHLSMALFQVNATKWFFSKKTQLSLIIREQVEQPHLTKNVLAERVIHIDALRSLDSKNAILEINRIVREQLSTALSQWANVLDSMAN